MSVTMGQHWVDISRLLSILALCWASVEASKHDIFIHVGLLLGQRLQRWPNAKPTLGEHLVSRGPPNKHGADFFYENHGDQRVILNLKSSLMS